MSATCFPLLAAAGDIAPSVDKSVLSLAQFEEKLRHVGRFGASALLQNPLEAAVGQINAGPALSQSRLLRRVLHALCAAQGEFRYAELSALDAKTVDIVIAVMDAARDGTISPRQLNAALIASDAAT